ncbi:QcrA and Rieske domain-containing protein [Nocardia aurantia]|uniref:Cytochrome bc1 complex Rieske iron-sulfur subunit n=1 Tax=Nocardia aurantia TaxID=2585199 RepID=A0A7K0DUK5_9NOCA|nr:Rieske (2Fe-2S) protein [Nocardia aurantia]MQY29441.1 Cytochrome b6-f complex iron-sulfur subunit [Nocardia aurantia]
MTRFIDRIDGTGSLDRRTALAGAGAAAATLGLVTACGGGDSPAAPPAGSSQPAAPHPMPTQQPATGLARTADVPVGGGVIVGDTVVTQPAAGSFLGFSSRCTHLGCLVNQVADGLIKCPCHNSSFHLDGTVAAGPASRPLDTRPVRVEGDQIVHG